MFSKKSITILLAGVILLNICACRSQKESSITESSDIDNSSLFQSSYQSDDLSGEDSTEETGVSESGGSQNSGNDNTSTGKTHSKQSSSTRGSQPTDNQSQQGGALQATAPEPGNYTGSIQTLQPSAQGRVTYSDGVSTIDASNSSEGYLMFSTAYSGGARLKLQVRSSDVYNYDISPGQWYTVPLQMGSGDYEIRLMENTTGTKYRRIYSQVVSVSIPSSLSPFLYPNIYVNYNNNSAAVKKSFDVCCNATTDAQKVAAVFSYITTNIAYDYDKASSVTSGYIPNVDEILAKGKGICFDYSVLMAVMLRSQGIPTKLAIGKHNGMDHAWNYIYLKESGWIAVGVTFQGGHWNFVDATMAVAGNGAESGYTTLRVY